MTDSSDRRAFRRFDIRAEAVALNEQGIQLGRVSEAGGGGMNIEADSDEIAAQLTLGRRLTITVFEPSNDAHHTIDVVVRHKNGRTTGVEFVTGKSS